MCDEIAASVELLPSPKFQLYPQGPGLVVLEIEMVEAGRVCSAGVTVKDGLRSVVLATKISFVVTALWQLAILVVVSDSFTCWSMVEVSLYRFVFEHGYV